MYNHVLDRRVPAVMTAAHTSCIKQVLVKNTPALHLSDWPSAIVFSADPKQESYIGSGPGSSAVAKCAGAHKRRVTSSKCNYIATDRQT